MLSFRNTLIKFSEKFCYKDKFWIISEYTKIFKLSDNLDNLLYYSLDKIKSNCITAFNELYLVTQKKTHFLVSNENLQDSFFVNLNK